MPAGSHPFERTDARLIAAAGALLFVVAVAAFVLEATPGWEDAQDEVRAVVVERLGEDRAEALPTGLQQIWLQDVDRVDRCVTCHTTIEWGTELADAPHPARSHPRPELLRAHPPDRFGCTLCHGGQGAAVEKDAAHGEVAFWEEPLLGAARAQRYGITQAQLLEMRCNTCHVHDADVAGMPLLNKAKAFVAKEGRKGKRCARCHTIFGEGGNKGPDLSREGDKHPTQYTFPASWSKRRTALQWQIEHFKEPFAVVPDTLMPTFMMEEEDAVGLALLVLSWRAADLPAGWYPRPK